jgi:hypothetical protein
MSGRTDEGAISRWRGRDRVGEGVFVGRGKSSMWKDVYAVKVLCQVEPIGCGLGLGDLPVFPSFPLQILAH